MYNLKGTFLKGKFKIGMYVKLTDVGMNYTKSKTAKAMRVGVVVGHSRNGNKVYVHFGEVKHPTLLSERYLQETDAMQSV